MIDVKESYKAMTLRIMANFQLLELTLKIYIGRAYEFIEIVLADRMHFAYSIKDVENHSLEKLLTTFAKLNSNIELIQRLNKLREKRNHVAHESLLITLGAMKNVELLHTKHGEFFHLEDELAECLTLIIEETRKLHAGFGIEIKH